MTAPRRHPPLKPCRECRDHTPRIGETVCERCKEARIADDARSEAIDTARRLVDEVNDPAARACIEALIFLVTGDY